MDEAAAFIASHPTLQDQMRRSAAFARIRERARIEIDDEVLYLVAGDTLGDEAALYVESVVRGASDQGLLYREVHDDLSDEERQLIIDRFSR